MKYMLAGFRKERGMTQRELADALGESRRNVEDWERGRRLPRVDKAVRIAGFFDASVEDMFEEEEGIG